jgi:flagellar basal-body rod protein FlgB
MDLLGDGLFDLAERRLQWLDRRQQVLAQNVANADTPGFRPRDLPDFAASLGSAATRPARTQPGHLPGTSGEVLVPDAALRPKARQPDGNGVALDEELTKVADVQTNQALVNNLYAKYVSFYRLALGRGS